MVVREFLLLSIKKSSVTLCPPPPTPPTTYYASTAVAASRGDDHGAANETEIIGREVAGKGQICGAEWQRCWIPAEFVAFSGQEFWA
ncbi:unnamed protein product [Linum trigynum]|uniref:Uncharacterized protein n=1 Tax=Linum trigynum TaxID=586398 RepID=A0AAV2E7K5_9ROSI